MTEENGRPKETADRLTRASHSLAVTMLVVVIVVVDGSGV